jgi:hypothetical protein
MAIKIQIRRDTAANWESTNPILAQGEPGLATDTNIVKYGDGVTDWKSLPASTDYAMTASSGNQWQYRTTSGSASFTYVIAGHVRTPFTVPAGQTGSKTTLTVDITTHPTITSVEQALYNYNHSNGDQPYFYINQVWQGFIDTYSVNAGIVTLTLDDSYTFAEGDQVVFAAWSKGTQSHFPYYYTTYGPSNQSDLSDGSNAGRWWGPVTDVVNGNVVEVNLTDENSNQLAALVANPYRSYMVFDEFNTDAAVTIKSAVRNGTSNTYTITFDGPPRNLYAKKQVTLNCNPAKEILDGYTLEIDANLHPEIVDFLYTSGQNGAAPQPYFTINSDPTQYLLNGFWPRGGGYDRALTYRDVWSLNSSTQFTITAQDTIHLHYTTTGTFIRMDYYMPDGSYETDQTTGNNVYRWLSWEKDLPFFKSEKGNGVQGGQIDFHIQVSYPKTKSGNRDDNRTFFVNFDPRGNSYGNALNYIREQVAFFNNTYDQTFGYNMTIRPMYDFYEDGIFFKANISGDNYAAGISQEIKVDIIWNARLFYGDAPSYEYWN